MLTYVAWSANPEIFTLGPITVRWYGLLFALGFLLGQQVLIRMYKAEGKPESDVEILTVYMVLSTIIGARLGHVLFYEPKTFWEDPIEVLKVWHGGLASHGAGIAIFIALYIYVNYGIAFFHQGKFLNFWKRRKPGQTYLWVTDRMVVTVALAGCCIRLGNLMNSEIIGKPADVPWAFVFAFPEGTKNNILEIFPNEVENIRIKQTGGDTLIEGYHYVGANVQVLFKKDTDENTANRLTRAVIPSTLGSNDDIRKNMYVVERNIHPTLKREGHQWEGNYNVYGKTRHPAQLYEALSCLVLFFILYGYWSRRKERTPEGSITGLFMVIVFTLRFFYEFLKEPQVDFENTLIADIGLNIGQLLSIPAVAFGLFLLIWSTRKSKAANVKA